MQCEQCGKDITEQPCPHCGGATIFTVEVRDAIPVKAELTGVVVEGPSEVTIEREGQAHTYPFGSGLASGEIVNASLMQENLSDVTPPYIQNALIYNINQIEKFARDSEGKETIHEHSFEINLGIFKYKFKRIVKED